MFPVSFSIHIEARGLTVGAEKCSKAKVGTVIKDRMEIMFTTGCRNRIGTANVHMQELGDKGSTAHIMCIRKLWVLTNKTRNTTDLIEGTNKGNPSGEILGKQSTDSLLSKVTKTTMP